MTTTTPPRVSHSVMAHYSGTKVVLLDTGNYPAFDDYLNQTWVFNGTDWSNASVGTGTIDSVGPLPGRVDSMLAFDGTHLVLFGGRSNTAMLGDTWTWNGTAWTQQTPATSPYNRAKAEMAYLSGSAVSVMFGGMNNNSILNETWTWNGTTWTQQAPTHVPPARIDACMAASASNVVLFGGKGTNSTFNDTWKYNGTDWTLQAPATSPSIRSDACMAYDTVNSLWVMFGGKNDSGLLAPETWTYNGTTWTKQAPATSPSGRVGAQMAFDSVTGCTIMFGGNDLTNPLSDTWKFDGGALTWTQL